MAWRMGVDIGGTFTDVVLVDEKTGHIGVAKVPTTTRDFAEGVLDGIRQGLERCEVDPAEVSLLTHATTIVTNALLEKKGARAGFVTTRGFRDVLELRRSSRADLYDLFQDAPAVLVPRRWHFEVTERIDAQGQIVTPLDERDTDGVIAAICGAGLETVAVSLLFSFLNDTHERILGERLRRALPGVHHVEVFLGQRRVTQRVGEAAGHRDMRMLGYPQRVEAALFERYRELRRGHRIIRKENRRADFHIPSSLNVACYLTLPRGRRVG